ncbi:MAG: hypothetical protein IPM39_12745 [Chloroflexi bacterium]|nr:hypothetical protein [Chloroflexota bacterium]
MAIMIRPKPIYWKRQRMCNKSTSERSAALFLTLGNVVYKQGDWRAADLVWLAATAHLYRGEMYLKTGKDATARQDFTIALETANTLNAPEQKAAALFGLARVSLSTHHEQSIRCARESAAIFAELGHCSVDSVRQWIKGIIA